MVIAEVTIHSGCELLEPLFCQPMLFNKSLNLCVCILKKVLNEAKTLVNKTCKVTDIFRRSVQLFPSLRLSSLQPIHSCIEIGLLMQGPLYVSFESSVEFFVSHK